MSIGYEIYEIIKKVLERESYVAAHTPDFCDDERINVLWLWAMENFDRLYDPDKGNLEAWIMGCRRRIIDVYREERLTKKTKEGHITVMKQYPDMPCDSELSFEEQIEDDHSPDVYNQDDKDMVHEYLSTDISVDNSWILINGFTNVKDKEIARNLGCSVASLHSRRKQTKSKCKDYFKEVDK